MGREGVDLDLLVKKSVAGDRTSLEKLLVYYYGPLLQYIRNRVGTYGSAGIGEDDILQETWVQACESIHSLEAAGAAAFFAWLKTVARTRMINLIKARQARKRGGGRRQIHAAQADATVTSIIQLVAGKDKTPSWILRRKEIVQEVGNVLAGLNPVRRQVMEMRFGMELSIEEIGHRLGLQKGAVKMNINRSLKQLRQAFAQSKELWESFS